MQRIMLAVAILSALTISCPGFVSAQSQPAPAPAKPEPIPAPAPGAVKDYEYKIGPEDVLNISVWKNDALSRALPVRPDGMISLPLLNDVQAAGLTPMELRDVLIKKLVEYIPAPEVSVMVTDVKSFKVAVIGEVGKPGRFELKSRTTVLDLLAEVGGFNQFAARGRIAILRPEGKKFNRIPFNYNKAIAGEQENFYLQPGDIILVP
jgi:polysaccharide export outer membrane protein